MWPKRFEIKKNYVLLAQQNTYIDFILNTKDKVFIAGPKQTEDIYLNLDIKEKAFPSI